MESSLTYYEELITRYLAGEASGKEIEILSDWLSESANNRDLYRKLRNTWLLVEHSKADAELDVDAEWFKLKMRIDESQELAAAGSQQPDARDITGFIRHHLNIYLILRIAAVFILVAVPSFYLIRYFSKTEIKSLVAGTRITEDGLPDGTLVTLNKGTTLKYSENFNGTRREVLLDGEALFKVRHIEKSRFVIVAGNIRIEDIGTSFYVNTKNAKAQMEVILTEGKASVCFINDPVTPVIISPGERADVNHDENTILKSVNHDENFLAWKTRKLVFNENTLAEVVVVLNKVYDADIRLSGKNSNYCLLSATFDNQSLESVLNVIRSTLDVSIISRGEYIEISGISCD